jgi:serine phosphatase RsbU (regulator of sigma subunit)
MANSPIEPSPERREPGFREQLGLLLTVFVLIVLTLGMATWAALDARDAAAQDITERIEPARSEVHALMREMIAPGLDRETKWAALAEVSRLIEGDDTLGREVEAIEGLVTAWVSGEGDIDLLLRRLDVLQSRLVQEQTALRMDLASAERRLHWLLWAILGLAVSWVGATFWCFRRWVSQPLQLVSQAANRVRAGDFQHPIPEVGSRELSGLARDVERMRARTVGLYEDSQRAMEALEQQGPAVQSLRAELAPSGARLPDAAMFAASLEPAEGVLAGDWYDCVDLGEGRVALALVDVSGHGPEAGIFALRAKHLLLAALEDRLAPGPALDWLASHIGETGERFLTAFVAELDTTDGQCRWANAGHPAGLVVANGQIEHLGPTGPLLGPFPGTWRTKQTTVPPGGTVVAYTDGVVEARNGSRQFGRERFLRMLEHAPEDSPETLVGRSVAEVRKFARGRTNDDMTVVALAFAPPVVDQRRPPATDPALVAVAPANANPERGR